MRRPSERQHSLMRSDRKPGRKLGSWRPGFTMTEMLIALFLATIGMVTVFGMQVAANVVQRQARDINAARMLGESFLTRLRGETVNWSSLTMADDCTQTNMPLCWWARFSSRGGDGIWVPAPRADFGSDSPRYNALGIPNDSSDTRISATPARVRNRNLRYCIHYNLAQVGAAVAPNELMRAQVRVFWPITQDAFAPPPLGVSDCGFSNVDNLLAAAARGQFRFTQLNTVLYRHEAFQ